MNYSEMSDFEINCAVAGLLGDEVYSNKDGIKHKAYRIGDRYRDVYASGWSTDVFDPVNSWADAGPIIHHELINILFDDDGYQIPESGWSYAKSPCGKQFYGKVNSPLRTAMIVFLMMKESDNG